MDTHINYPGVRYTTTLPDTLDLADRAHLAIRGIGGTIDPELHHQMYFMARLACRPPFMQHHSADTTCDPKYAESFALLRLMCGAGDYEAVEDAQRAELLSRIDDGLYWNRVDPARPWRNTYNPAFDRERKDEDLANAGGNGRMLRALVTWRELTADPRWDDAIRQLVGGLRRIALDRDDYSYFPDGGFGEPFNYPRSGWLRTDEPGSETEGGEGSVVCYQGHQIQGLARWFALSGDEQALELARRITRFCMLPRFWGGVADPGGDTAGLVGHVAARGLDPACVSGAEQGHWYSHFHARAIALRGMLEVARVAGDEQVLEFVRRSYEHTWAYGIPRIGWVNTYPVRVNLCEGCALGDLVALGVHLTDAGVGDYWDDVDALARNHLIEQQLTRADVLQRISAASAELEPKDRPALANQAVFGDEVIARSLGTFAGHSTPVSIPNPWVMQCCTGNGTQGLYYAWEAILREGDGSAQVNLLLNRAGQSVDVDSYLPHEGKVVLSNKTNRRIAVRMPSWAGRTAVRLHVSGLDRPVEWVGHYLLVDELKPGDQAVVTFPVPETTARYTVNARTDMEQTYTCAFRGSTCVDIRPRDPSPTSYPLYERDHLRSGVTPMKVAMRFASDRVIRNW